MDSITQALTYNPDPETLARIKTARTRLELMSITGAYLISDKAAHALKRHQGALYEADMETVPYDSCEKLCDATKTCLETIRTEAQTLVNH